VSGANPFWWREKTPHTQVWSHVQALEQRQRHRIWRDFVNERIYGSTVGIDALKGMAISDMLRSTGFTSADLNFTRTIVDALVARVGNNRPAIKSATDGADWSQRRLAKTRDMLIEGEFECQKVPAKAPLALRDALVTRGGVMEVGTDQGRIFADRVPCEELRYDDREGRYGEPRQMHRVMRVAKEVLAAKFPEHKGVIDNAAEPQAKANDNEAGGSMDSGMIEVAKSWHLPSGPKASDGRWALTIAGATLDDGPWKRDHFPFAIIRWAPPRRGFWGSSLVDELASLQFKVNEVARDLMQNIYFTSAVKVLTRRGANITKEQVAGKRPHRVEVDSPSDAIWQAPDGFSPAQFQFLQWLIQQMFEVSGVSQLMTQSKNPLGANASGAALAEFYDIESERFSQLEQGYATFWRDIGQLIVEAAQDLSDDAEFKKTEVKWSKKGSLYRMKWGDVDFKDDGMEVQLEEAGYLPQTRAGKMERIEALIAAGMLDPDWAMSLVDFPDLKQANRVRNAPLDWVLWAMEQLDDVEIDDKGEVVDAKSAPIPLIDDHMNLKLTMSVAKAFYQQHITNGTKDKPTPEALLTRYRTFIDSVDAQLAKNAPAATPPPAPGGMDMTAPPMPGAMDSTMPPGGAPMDPAAAMLPPPGAIA